MQKARQENGAENSRSASLLNELTITEKMALLAGGDFVAGASDAAFPVGTLLASTWNTALVARVGMGRRVPTVKLKL